MGCCAVVVVVVVVVAVVLVAVLLVAVFLLLISLLILPLWLVLLILPLASCFSFRGVSDERVEKVATFLPRACTLLSLHGPESDRQTGWRWCNWLAYLSLSLSLNFLPAFSDHVSGVSAAALAICTSSVHADSLNASIGSFGLDARQRLCARWAAACTKSSWRRWWRAKTWRSS